MASFLGVDVFEQLMSFFVGDAPQSDSVGTLAVQLPLVDGVGLGLASYTLSFCIVGGKSSLQDVLF